MKNVQVIDGAENCIFPIYSVSEEDFSTIFPGVDHTVEFAQDLVERLSGSEKAAGGLIMRVTARKIDKRNIEGIHGTLFIDLPNRKKHFPSKREDDVFVP